MGEATQKIAQDTGLSVTASSVVSMIGKGGVGAALLAILLYFGGQMLEEQKKLTSAVIEGNSHMSRMTQEMREAVKEMSASRIAFESRKP